MITSKIKHLAKIYREHPTLDSDRLILRKLDFNDIDAIYDYGRDPLVSKYLVWNAHTSRIDTRDFLNTVVELYNKYRLLDWGIVLKESNKLIGTVSFVNMHRNILCGEVGYVLSRKFWNNGIMSEALNTVLHFAFTEMQLNRVEAQVDPENTASSKVLEKCGFQFEGIRRDIMYYKDAFHTLKLYSILNSDFSKDS